MDSVFVDIFTLRRFESLDQLHELIGVKKNGQPQSDEYVAGIRSTIETSAFSQGEVAPLCPFWHFNTRKAVEMWPKEVYREALTLTLTLTLSLIFTLTLSLTLTLTPTQGSYRVVALSVTDLDQLQPASTSQPPLAFAVLHEGALP